MPLSLGPIPAIPNTAIAPNPLAQMLSTAVQGYMQGQIQRPEYERQQMLLLLQQQQAQQADLKQRLEMMNMALQLLPGNDPRRQQLLQSMTGLILGGAGGSNPPMLPSGGAPVQQPGAFPTPSAGTPPSDFQAVRAGMAPDAGVAQPGQQPVAPDQVQSGIGFGPNASRYLRSQGYDPTNLESLSPYILQDPTLKQMESMDEKARTDQRADIGRLDTEQTAIRTYAANENADPDALLAMIGRYNAHAKQFGQPGMTEAEAKGLLSQSVAKWGEKRLSTARQYLHNMETEYGQAINPQRINESHARDIAARMDAYAKQAAEFISRRTGIPVADVLNQLGGAKHAAGVEADLTAGRQRWQLEIDKYQLSLKNYGLRVEANQLRREANARAKQTYDDLKSGKLDLAKLDRKIVGERAQIKNLEEALKGIGNLTDPNNPKKGSAKTIQTKLYEATAQLAADEAVRGSIISNPPVPNSGTGQVPPAIK